jgi:dolichol-phosphate mannosyltransferase
VSFAIPVFNEEETIPELLRRVDATLDATPGGPHEIVVADDGSTDRTLELLRREVEHRPRLVVICLSRNFGHQAALSAALDHTTADVVFVIDGDLQDPPEALPLFLDRHRQGFDVVFGRRVQRKEAWWLRACYSLFYRLTTALSDPPLPVDSGDFALLSRRVVDAIKQAPERHRYLRGLRTWVGFPQASVEVPRAARAAGRSKYSFAKLMRLAFDGILAFSVVPLRLATLLGLAAIVMTSAYAAYALFARLFLSESPRGFTALIVAIVFLAGVQLVVLGVLGEYIGRIFHEVKQRPLYLVKELIRLP